MVIFQPCRLHPGIHALIIAAVNMYKKFPARQAAGMLFTVASARRNFLKKAVQGTGALLSAPALLRAQDAGQRSLQQLPKMALVIGNAGYAASPLENPVNDAREMRDCLTELGFGVTCLFDASREQMYSAARAYLAYLEKNKCIGLFYYAGHGVQLAWKNYLLPVDAEVTDSGQIAQRCFDLGFLTAGLVKASNPMNLVVLDACRNNPFGQAVRPEQKGLSQADAPHSTILAYATAPGNTASDGGGANGLYTEHLLREMRVRHTKVEDVFKRVRLHVRRHSKGEQIPWESTSLEHDYYFLPPATGSLSMSDENRRFAEELALWDSIRGSTASQVFADYLARYPSGRHAELAQFALNRLLAQEGEKPVSLPPAAGNPYTAGTAAADTGFKPGDTYQYLVRDLVRNTERQDKLVVTAVTENEVIFGDGSASTDLMGNPTKRPDGVKLLGLQIYPAEYVLGKRWSTRFQIQGAALIDSMLDLQIVAKEWITVPAGRFECYRVEAQGRHYQLGIKGKPVMSELRTTYWCMPAVCRRVIKSERIRYRHEFGIAEKVEHEQQELAWFRQA